MIKTTMDALLDYLQSNYHHDKSELILLLDTKITITIKHIENMKYTDFNIIKLFEEYGYVFTDDDYLKLVKKSGYFLQWIKDDKKTKEICEIALKSTSLGMIIFVPKHFRHLKCMYIEKQY